MADENEVTTVFTASDKASDTIATMARAADQLRDSAESASQATGKVGVPPTAVPPPGGEEGLSKAEKEEARTRRERIKSIKLEEEKGNLAGNASKAFASTLGLEGSSFTEKLAGAGEHMEAVGFQMARFDGSLGEAGKKLIGLAGKIGTFAPALAIGVGIGSLISEWLNRKDEKAREMANRNYVKALGYRSSEEYFTAMQLQKQTIFHRELAANVQKAAMKMGAMPIDKTGAAMANFDNEVLNTAKAFAHTPEEIQEAVNALKEAAEKNVPSILAENKHRIMMGKELQEASAGIKRLPWNATEEEMIKYDQALGTAAKALIDQGKILPSMAKEAMEGMRKSVEDQAAVKAKAFEDTTKFGIFMEKEAERQMKHFKVVSPHASVSKLVDMNEDMAWHGKRAILAMEKKLGKDLTGDQRQEVLEKVHSAMLEKQQKTFDFRGSRFDIKQAFAPGFDPDRIAVAFANDLARVGEFRGTSQHSTTFKGH